MRRLVVALLGLAACGSDAPRAPRRQLPELPPGLEASDPRGDPRRPPRRLITLRPQSGIIAPTRQIIDDAPGWDRFWTIAFSNERPQLPQPRISFEHEMLIVAGMGTRPNSGYSIHIDSVIAAEELRIYVRSVEPPPGCTAWRETSEPVTVVAVRPSDLPERFIERTEYVCPDTMRPWPGR